MELSNSSFLPNPSDTAKGYASFAWVEQGAYLVGKIGQKASAATDAIWLFGRDEQVPEFKVLYYDSRRVSRVYEMSFSGLEWKMWRQSPDFWQRFEGKFSDDGNTTFAHWDKSGDGIKWEHDFDLTYKRVR